MKESSCIFRKKMFHFDKKFWREPVGHLKFGGFRRLWSPKGITDKTVTTFSRSEFWVVWPQKMPASGWGSLWESSSFVPWFSTFVFRNVPGTVSECVCICWFERKSSNLVRAPKMGDSVLLNSWDSFLVTLPSISSETCVIYSSLILGTDVFRDWPFLGSSSCVSLVTAANFRLFLNVAIFEEKMLRRYEDWIILYLLINLRL